MNEEQIRAKFKSVTENELQSIIQRMTHLVMDVFELGFNTGLEIGLNKQD